MGEKLFLFLIVLWVGLTGTYSGYLLFGGLIIIFVAFFVYAIISTKKKEEREREESEHRNLQREVEQKANAIGPVLNSYHEMEKSLRINKAASYVAKIVEEHLQNLLFLQGEPYKIVLHIQNSQQDSWSAQREKTIDINFSELDLEFNFAERVAFLYLVLQKSPALIYRCEVNGIQQETRDIFDAYFSPFEGMRLYVKTETRQ